MTTHLLSSRQPILDKIVFFCAVVRLGSFREASTQQGISPAAGSRWVKELEEAMSVELIKRSTRHLVATQAGQLLYERFSPLLPDIHSLCEEVQNLAEEQRGEIKLSSTPLFARQYLTKIVAEYIEMHPQVNFKIFIEAGEFDPLSVDFAFRASASYQGEPEQDSLLIRRRMLREPLYLCASPNYLEKHGTPNNPSELSLHRCLYASTLVGGNKWCFEHSGTTEVATIRDTIECDNSEILLDLSLAQAGIAYLPHSLVSSQLKHGELQHIMQDYQCASFDVDIFFRPRTPMPERCAGFKDYLYKRVDEIRSSNVDCF
ncbi:LysR family transcriptional regulator [Vibrio sp. M260118]|uniref:LysR family transcriptional regulator n=1 Tax=Vibrio sp. M260118 TaxID=3020896 RepID=UPI002F3E376A